MRQRAALAALAALVALACLPAAGSSAQEPAAAAVKELAPVEIRRKTNAGDLPYRSFFRIYTYLQSLVPPEPRLIDLYQRVNFNGMSQAEQDAFMPESWAVAIVSATIDHTVPVSRGGYFLLPELKQAYEEGGTIMFNTQTAKGYMSMVWKLRIPETQTLSYADFAQALREAEIVQKQIPWYRYGLRYVRRTGHDGLRACFLQPDGHIEIDGKAAATVQHGACQILKFDPAIARDGKAGITFVGPVDIVTLQEVVP